VSRLHVVHTTTIRYAGPVAASYNEARMTPLTQPGQMVLEARLDIKPQTWAHDFRDYWGTAVTAFEVLAPHELLVLVAESRVDMVPRPAAKVAATWDTLRSPALRDRLAEFLADTPTTAVPDEVVELAVPGVTEVHSPAADAWAARTGVCQDMAHLAAGALRSIGIPARYVSGYLYPSADGEIGQTLHGESHAWVEWWAGEWFGYDPTNRVPVGEQHVVLGRGRSYDDVPPLRGIFAGSGTLGLDVQVQITRET